MFEITTRPLTSDERETARQVWLASANSVSPTGDMGCYTVDGKEVWKLDLQKRYGRFNIAFGMSSTPVLDDGRLFLQLIHGDGKAETQEALVVAIDALTGEGIWKQDRITAAI